MAVYVDDVRAMSRSRGAKVSHLIADTDEELHMMAGSASIDDGSGSTTTTYRCQSENSRSSSVRPRSHAGARAHGNRQAEDARPIFAATGSRMRGWADWITGPIVRGIIRLRDRLARRRAARRRGYK